MAAQINMRFYHWILPQFHFIIDICVCLFDINYHLFGEITQRRENC